MQGRQGDTRSADKKLEGVIVPLVTPVREDGSPDLAAVRRLTRWLIDAGVRGLFVGGTTGRFSHFTPEDMAAVCRVVVSEASGSVSVLGGICDSGLRRMQANAERMTKAGADFLVATAPYYLPYSDAEREAVLGRIIETVPRPVVLYNIPELVGASLREEWILDIGTHPNVAGLKDSSNDYAYFDRILRRRPRPEFAMIQGKEPLVARSLIAGADGMVISLAQINPTLLVALARAVRTGDHRRAERCQLEMQHLYDRFQALMRAKPFFATLLLFLEREMSAHSLKIRLI